jgi:hypothetical protein
MLLFDDLSIVVMLSKYNEDVLSSFRVQPGVVVFSLTYLVS